MCPYTKVIDNDSHYEESDVISVLDGKLERNAGVRILRDNVVIHEGKLASLKRFKDDAREVTKGFECGMH